MVKLVWGLIAANVLLLFFVFVLYLLAGRFN